MLLVPDQDAGSEAAARRVSGWSCSGELLPEDSLKVGKMHIGMFKVASAAWEFSVLP